MFDFKTIIVVSPEASVQVETLVKAVENGKRISSLPVFRMGSQPGLPEQTYLHCLPIIKP